MIYIISVTSGDLWISGGGSSGKLEFQVYESDHDRVLCVLTDLMMLLVMSCVHN